MFLKTCKTVQDRMNNTTLGPYCCTVYIIYMMQNNSKLRRKIVHYRSDEPSWLSHQCKGGNKLSFLVMESFRDLFSGIDVHVGDLRQFGVYLE